VKIMKKLTISILSLIAIAMLVGIAFADPWETFKNVAYSRSDVTIGPGFDFTTSAAGTVTLTNGATIPAGGTLAGTVTGDVTGNVTAAGTVQAEQLTSTDDARIGDMITTHRLWVNTTSSFVGPATFSDALVLTPYSATTDTATTNTSIPGLWFVGNASANQTITLPDAATASGAEMTFVITVDPGSYYVIIDGYNSEKINGADTKKANAQYEVLDIVCDVTAWFIKSYVGTWD